MISLDANNDNIHFVGYADNAQGVLDPRKHELGWNTLYVLIKSSGI